MSDFIRDFWSIFTMPTENQLHPYSWRRFRWAWMWAKYGQELRAEQPDD